MAVPMMTFTGVDAKTSAGWINAIARKYTTPSGYGAIEFAILRSPKVGQSPRYPDREAIAKITSYVYPQNLAFHLCGRYARMVFDLEWMELCDIVDFNLVSRVQVNSTECDEKAMLTLQRFAIHIDKPVVMQWRGDSFPCVPGVQLLQDRSGGQGVSETRWISPDRLAQKGRGAFGYAGGLTPANLPHALPDMVAAACRRPFWIDCESGVRTNDWLDPAKVEAMIHAAVDAGIGIKEN